MGSNVWMGGSRCKGWVGGGGGVFFFFKQKTAYEIGTGDWSSDVCSSDLPQPHTVHTLYDWFTIVCGFDCIVLQFSPATTKL